MWYYVEDLKPVGYAIFEDDSIILTEHHEVIYKYNLVNIPEDLANKLQAISVKYRVHMKTIINLWGSGMLKDGGFV